MARNFERLAVLFGGLSAQHEPSVLMFDFFRREIQHTPIGIPYSFYYLDLFGNVVHLPSPAAFQFKRDEPATAAHGETMCRPEFIVRLSQPGTFVFSLLQGRESEEGVLQGVMDFCGIPSNLGSIGAAYLSVDKRAFSLAAESAFPERLTPIESILVGPSHDREELRRVREHFADREFVVKANRQGASVLLQISSRLEPGELERLADATQAIGDQLLFQERIVGREITCGCVRVKGRWVSLGCVSLEPDSGVMGREEKSGLSLYRRSPVDRDSEVSKRIELLSLDLAERFGFHTQCRFDYILDSEDRIYLFEANSKPGLLSTSLYVNMLQAAGLSIVDLVGLSMDHETEASPAGAYGARVREIIAANGQAR